MQFFLIESREKRINDKRNQFFCLQFRKAKYFHIFNRIMSVNSKIAPKQITQIVSQTQEYVYSQLKKYQIYLVESQNQLKNTITMHLSQIFKEQQLYKNTISQLNQQIMQLKDDNSFLRNQFMNSAIKLEQVEKSRLRVIQQRCEKEQKIRQLADEVQKIRNSTNRSPIMRQAESIISFDEDDNSPIKINRFQGLQTIKEVSQYDLSMTMSLQSFKSQILNDSCNGQTAVGTENQLLQKSQVESKQSLGTENYQIDNYQDALMILKSYNSSGRGMKMTKKPTLEVEKCASDDILHKESLKRIQKKGNETINKIKKMRKIQDLDIQTKVISKSNQQNICYQDNECVIQEQTSSIVQSKLQYCDEHHESTVQEKPKSSSSSINSNKFVSRINQVIMNLENPIKKVAKIIKEINSIISHPIKKAVIKDEFRRISYAGGLEFVGHCNESEEPSGFGKLLLNKQAIYQGEWRSGKFHGWGKLILLSYVKNNQKMIIETDGHFKSGMMQGSVVCTFTTGEKFMGIIKDENIEKEGTFVGEKGIMTGYWESNKLIYLI